MAMQPLRFRKTLRAKYCIVRPKGLLQDDYCLTIVAFLTFCLERISAIQ